MRIQNLPTPSVTAPRSQQGTRTGPRESPRQTRMITDHQV